MYGKSYKTITVSATVSAIVEDAFNEVSELADEIREWSDNMQNSEGLSQTEKAQLVEEAADALEEHREFDGDIPARFAEKMLSYQIGVKRYRSDGAPSRAARLGNACLMLRAVLEETEAALENNNKDADSSEDEDSQAAELEAFRDSLQQHVDELEGVEIPTAYG